MRKKRGVVLTALEAGSDTARIRVQLGRAAATTGLILSGWLTHLGDARAGTLSPRPLRRCSDSRSRHGRVRQLEEGWVCLLQVPRCSQRLDLALEPEMTSGAQGLEKSIRDGCGIS